MKIKDITEGVKKNKKKLPVERNPFNKSMDAIRKSGAGGAHKAKEPENPRKAKHKKNAVTTEAYKDADYAKGKGPMPKKTTPSKTGEQKHPLKGKLVGGA